MWEDAKKIYDYVDEKGIYADDLDIQLHVYVFPKSVDVTTCCKENQYRFYLPNQGGTQEDTILSYVRLMSCVHYDFTYTDIDSLEWITNCSDETKFTVGTCASAGFNFSIFSEKYLDDGSKVSYEGIAFKGALVIPVYDFYHKDNLIVQKQLGVFHVTEYEIEAGMINFTCLDNMKFLDKKAKKITELDPNTQAFKSDELILFILNQRNLYHEEMPDVEYFKINKVKHLKKLTYRTIMSYALEAIGAYAYANEMGEICIKCFNASDEPVATISYDDIMEDKSNGEETKINGYDISYNDYQVTAFYYEEGEEEIEMPVPMTVDNPLFAKKQQDTLDTIGTRIDSRMRGFAFESYEVTTALPYFYVEAGDFVNVEDEEGEIHKILVNQLLWSDNLGMEIVSSCNMNDEYESTTDQKMNQLFQSVSSGKEEVASAITDKGVTTESDATFQELADNIREINGNDGEKIACIRFNGKEFNGIIKQLSSNYSSVDYETNDDIITKFKVTNTPPVDGAEKVLLSYTVMQHFLYAYMSDDKSICYLYTNAEMVTLPTDCSYMFYAFRKCVELNLSIFDSMDTTDMSYMFSEFGSNAGETVGMEFNMSNLNTANTTNMEGMFYNFGLGIEGSDNNPINVSLGEIDTTSVINCDHMFVGFFRELKDYSQRKWGVDSITPPSYLENTWVSGYQLVIGVKCSKDNDYENCDPLSALGRFVLRTGTYDKCVDEQYRMRAGIITGDTGADEFTYHTYVRYLSLNGSSYKISEEEEATGTIRNQINSISSHTIDANFSEYMINMPIFTNKRALYDYALTARIYDFDYVNESYRPKIYSFNSEGQIIDIKPLYFNEAGGLQRSSTHPVSVQVDKLTFDLGEKFILRRGVAISNIFKNATFFEVNSETFEYLQTNYSSTDDIFLHVANRDEGGWNSIE